MKIKILYIIETLGIGGAENLLLNTVKFLNKNDFEPYVLYLFYDDDLAKEFEEMEVSVIGPIFDNYSCVGVNNIVDFFRGINRVRKIVRKVKPDIVHTNLFFANIYGRLGSWFGGVNKVITTLHNIDYSEETNNSFRFILRKSLDFITGRLLVKTFIVGNKAIKENMMSYMGSNNIELVYNGIDVNQIRHRNFDHSMDNIKEELGLRPEENVLLNIGRLHYQKGQRFLIEAMPNIIKNSKTKLLIAGSGPLEQELKLLAKKLGVADSVIFLGKRKDIDSIIELSDIFVFPSLFEGLAISLLEVMAHAKPVILFDYQGAQEIIVNQNEGLVIPVRDVDALEKGILTLLGSSKMRKKMGENSLQKVDILFNVAKNNRALEKIYFDVMNTDMYPA
jgi:glycosyltransferase involved in cell wall biosynthesis